MAVPTTAPTLFGAYIQSISTSVGWGGQGGTCQLVLIEDPDNNITIPRHYDNGKRVLDSAWPAGTPFTGGIDNADLDSPKIGTAVGLRYGDFYFGGIFQRYTYSESLSGRVYNVILESPAKLFDGIQVILDEFQGTIFAPKNAFYPFFGSEAPTQFDKSYVNNVWNVYAELENYAYNTETGGHFGNGDVNSVGMPVLTLLEILQKFGDDADGIFGGPAEFGSSKYKFDFSELTEAVEANIPEYRVKGPVSNLNGILSDICETMQHQYFPQVIGPAGADTDGIANPIIKIRMIDMGQQPTPGVIEDLVQNKKDEGKLISSSVGKELQDATTQKVVIGGAASRYYDSPVTDFLSVWQKKVNGDYDFGGLAVAQYTGTSATDPGYSGHTIPLRYPDQFGAVHYYATIFEMRMALGGMETWEIYKAFQSMLELYGGTGYTEPNPDLYSGPYPPWFARIATTKDILEKIAGQTTITLDLANTFLNQAGQAYSEEQKKLSQKMFNVVSKAASEFYGQVFYAPLPYEIGGQDNNIRWITEDYQYEAAWEITDSAWYYDKATGADGRPVGDVLGYDGEGRLKAHSTWRNDGISDFSVFGGDYSVGFGGRLCTTKGGPDKDLFWITTAGGDIYPYGIVRTGAQVRSYDSYTTPDFGLTVLAQIFFGIDIPPAAYISPGKEAVQIAIPPGVALPLSIGVPQESRVYRWGPWYRAAIKTGKAEVILDDSLRPETFGSSSVLDQAGLATAFAGVGELEAVESGFVEIAEFPSFNIGDRWSEMGPYVTDLQIDVSTDGCKCTYKFNTWTPNFGKLAKYNMDRIARVNQASLAFAQEKRSRMEKRPFPSFSFEKSDFSVAKNGGGRFAQMGIQTINGIMEQVFD